MTFVFDVGGESIPLGNTSRSERTRYCMEGSYSMSCRRLATEMSRKVVVVANKRGKHAPERPPTRWQAGVRLTCWRCFPRPGEGQKTQKHDDPQLFAEARWALEIPKLCFRWHDRFTCHHPSSCYVCLKRPIFGDDFVDPGKHASRNKEKDTVRSTAYRGGGDEKGTVDECHEGG